MANIHIFYVYYFIILSTAHNKIIMNLTANPTLPKTSLKRTSSEVLEKKSSHSEKQSVQSHSGNSSIRVSKHMARQLVANSLRNRQTQLGVEEVFRSAFRLFVCKMCYNNVDLKDTACMGDCGHNFCVECLTQYSIYKIKIHQTVLCPEQTCKTQLTQQSELYKLLPEPIQDKFKENALWKQTFQNPNLKLCQKQQCKGGLIDMLKQPPTCQKCQKEYCKECMMGRHDGPCDQNFEFQFKQWKRCPNCRIFIQKTQGCNHMTCRCGFQFCFVCISNWDPAHYQCVDGLNNRLFFPQTQQMSKCKALLALIGLCLLVPIFIIGLGIMLCLGIGFSSALGIIVAPCALAKQISGCCCCGIFWIILLPFALVIGAIAAPIVFTFSSFKPFAHRFLRQHFNSIQFLAQQINGRRGRR